MGDDTERFTSAKNMMMGYTAQFDGVEVASAEDIIKVQEENQKAWLVDVRNAEERLISMIPNAITQAQFEEAMRMGTVSRTDIIIPYCTMGYRSGIYATNLKKQGYNNVKNGEGVVLWTYSKVSLVTKDCDGKVIPVNKVHTFGAQWDLAARSYQSHHYSPWDMVYKGILQYFGF